MKEGLCVKFWGTRGSCASPGRDMVCYGGNTSCVSAAWNGGAAVFDAGTGIGNLGRWLEGREDEIHLFISHLHLDHICGLPMFSCLFRKNAVIHIYGEAKSGMTFKQALGNVIRPPYWPVDINDMPAKIIWHEIKADSRYEIGEGAAVYTFRASHPDEGILYRLEAGGQSVVYGLDCEIIDSIKDSYQKFAMDCGMLIFDAAYTQDEYPAHRGYGHGTWQQGIEMARRCRAKCLCLCHHEWKRTDMELDEFYELAGKYGAEAGIKAVFAKEGEEFFMPDCFI